MISNNIERSMDRMKATKKPLLIIMETDGLEDARELNECTRELEKKYNVDYLYTHKNRNVNYSAKRQVVEITYNDEINDDAYLKYALLWLIIFVLTIVVISLKIGIIS